MSEKGKKSEWIEVETGAKEKGTLVAGELLFSNPKLVVRGWSEAGW